MALTTSDIAEIQRETAHLIPEHPQYHHAGLMGFAYGGIGLAAYWFTAVPGMPPAVSAVIALIVAYVAGRYDGRIAWRHYHREFDRRMSERMKSDA